MKHTLLVCVCALVWCLCGCVWGGDASFNGRLLISIIYHIYCSQVCFFVRYRLFFKVGTPGGVPPAPCGSG